MMIAASNESRSHLREIKSRADLSCTDFNSRNDNRNWSVPHDDQLSSENCILLGQHFFSEMAVLASCGESDAFDAIRFALLSGSWNPRFATEVGFSAELAAVAIIGLRAIRNGSEPFDYENKKKRLLFGVHGPVKNNKLKGR